MWTSFSVRHIWPTKEAPRNNYDYYMKVGCAKNTNDLWAVCQVIYFVLLVTYFLLIICCWAFPFLDVELRPHIDLLFLTHVLLCYSNLFLLPPVCLAIACLPCFLLPPFNIFYVLLLDSFLADRFFKRVRLKLKLLFLIQ